ncbi:MAG: FHIPEP family type III secretion protein, partial [Sedimentisphaerales bacterium]|nr:FHIPEP family type III secretion protein [Sedimentisphaerales bacterium]
MNQAHRIKDRSVWGGILTRSEFTSYAMAAALLAGLLLPIPERAFDVLLIVGLSLAMAVLMAAVLARRAIELGSFPMLVAAAVLVRMGQDVAAARMILFDNRAGMLVGIFSRPASGFSSGWLTIAVLGCGLILGILSLRAAARTRQRAIQFTVQGAVIKRAAIAAERQLGSLNMTQSRELMRQIGREVGFHQNMTAVARLLACQAVVALVAVSVTALVLEFRSTPQMIYEQAYLAEPLIVGFAGISLGTTLLLSTTSAGLLNKPGLVTSRLELANHEPSPQKVTIVSEQSGESEEVELINPEFLTKEQNNPF